MSGSKPTSPNTPDVAAGAVCAELEKILSAQAFANSGRQSRFLRFVVEEALAGRGAQVKEYLIGVEVYDRGEGYDPRVDTIVRVEASRLRSRLAEYYKTDGAADPVRIDLPRGSYVPSFSAIAKSPVETDADSCEPLSTSGKLGMVAAGAVILLAGAVWWMAQSRPAAAKHEPPSIAVLPFTDLSPDKDQEYFCDGMTEELIGALSHVDGLRVAARTSSFEFKGQAQDVRAIGARLSVGHVLEGSVRKDGNRLRIAAQLIKAGDGYHVWSETYDGDLKDVFAVQQQISRAIVDNLKLKLAVEVPAPVRTGDLEAYNQFLRGRFFQSKFTPEGEQKSIEMFEQAIARDPKFALAYAGLADTYLILGFWGALQPEAVEGKALRAANYAAQLDSSLSDPHVSLGAFQAMYGWNWAESEREFRRAIELNPRNPAAHTYFGVLCLTPLGRLDEALAEVHKGRELDPLSREANSSVGLVHYHRREYDQAIQALRSTIDLDPTFGEAYPELASAYLAKGKFTDALSTAEKLETVGQSRRAKCLQALIRATMGQAADARRLMAEVEPSPGRVETASLYAALGDRDQALRSLKQALEEHDNHVIWMNVAPTLDRIRSDPRFTALAQRVKLPVPAR